MIKKVFLILCFWIVFSGVSWAASYDRIISLAPNLTEILYALELGDRVVAVTNYCDFPEEAKLKPKIGGMTNPSLEAVVAMKPDMVVLTTDGNFPQFERKLRKLAVKTYVFRVNRIAELPQGIRDLGVALQARDKANELAGRIEKAIIAIRTKYRLKKGGQALFIVQTEPLIVAGTGTAIDEAINILGWKNIASAASGQYPRISVEEIIARSPDVIFIPKDNAFMMGPTTALMKQLATVEAVKKKRVFNVGDTLFRMGPRVIDGIRQMDACLSRIN